MARKNLLKGFKKPKGVTFEHIESNPDYGGAVRAVMEAVGVTDVLSKSLGSNSSVNVVRATFEAITSLMDAKVVAKNRGKSLEDLWG